MLVASCQKPQVGVFSLGIVPYINSSIVFQLLARARNPAPPSVRRTRRPSLPHLNSRGSQNRL